MAVCVNVGIDACIVEPVACNGSAYGVSKRRSSRMTNSVVEAVDQENRADLVGTLIHESAHT